VSVADARSDVLVTPGPCVTCGIRLRRGTTPLVCEGCGSGCHAALKCSGLRRGLSVRGWRCSPCGGPPPSGGTGELVAGCPVRRLAEGSGASQRPAREPCLMCGRQVRRSGRLLRCSQCDRASHHKCSALTRDELARPNPSWVCSSCAPPSPRAPSVGAEDEDIAHRVGGAEFLMRGCLRVMQWNADGIRGKGEELGHYINEHRVDVCLVQESKLGQRDRTPRFPGFTTIRQDRPHSGVGGARGGGLLTLVREDIPYRRCSSVRDAGDSALESLSVVVPVGGGEKLTIVNVYCPPSRRPQGEEGAAGFDPATLPCHRGALIGGDLNVHSPLWDPFQPGDAGGGGIGTVAPGPWYDVLERWVGNACQQGDWWSQYP